MIPVIYYVLIREVMDVLTPDAEWHLAQEPRKIVRKPHHYRHIYYRHPKPKHKIYHPKTERKSNGE